MNKSYIEWIDYYENATKEDVIQDMMLDINSIKEKDKEIDRLSKEVDMWNKKYNEQFDIIYKVEKWLNESRNISLAQDNRIAVSYIDMVLDKLNELKGEGK